MLLYHEFNLLLFGINTDNKRNDTFRLFAQIYQYLGHDILPN